MKSEEDLRAIIEAQKAELIRLKQEEAKTATEVVPESSVLETTRTEAPLSATERHAEAQGVEALNKQVLNSHLDKLREEAEVVLREWLELREEDNLEMKLAESLTAIEGYLKPTVSKGRSKDDKQFDADVRYVKNMVTRRKADIDRMKGVEAKTTEALSTSPKAVTATLKASTAVRDPELEAQLDIAAQLEALLNIKTEAKDTGDTLEVASTTSDRDLEGLSRTSSPDPFADESDDELRALKIEAARLIETETKRQAEEARAKLEAEELRREQAEAAAKLKAEQEKARKKQAEKDKLRAMIEEANKRAAERASADTTGSRTTTAPML